MTYRELKHELSKLSEEQLAQEVLVLADDSEPETVVVWVAEEDQINPEGDGMEPVSRFVDDPDYADEKVVAKKGDVFLMLEPRE